MSGFDRPLCRCLLLLAAFVLASTPPLAVSATRGELRGRVLEDSSRFPGLEGCLLTLTRLRGGTLQSRSNIDGSFKFSELDPGVYTLRASHRNRMTVVVYPIVIPDTLGSDKEISVVLPFGNGVLAENPHGDGAMIVGVVLAGERPVANAEICFSRAGATPACAEANDVGLYAVFLRSGGARRATVRVSNTIVHEREVGVASGAAVINFVLGANVITPR